MKLPEEVLMAYVDGELDAAAVDEVENAIAADPEMRAAVARAQALRQRLKQAYAPVLDEPVPERLLRAARGDGVEADVVVPLRRPAPAAATDTPRRWHLPQWAALAASLALGLMLAPLLWKGDTRQVDLSQGLPVAGGALADALENRLASDPAAEGVRVGLSFRSREGDYCRTFSAASPRPVAGLACRDTQGWRLSALGTAVAEAGELRQASSAIPPAILAEVEARLAGDVLDAQGERAARAAGWR